MFTEFVMYKKASGPFPNASYNLVYQCSLLSTPEEHAIPCTFPSLHEDHDHNFSVRYDTQDKVVPCTHSQKERAPRLLFFRHSKAPAAIGRDVLRLLPYLFSNLLPARSYSILPVRSG